MLFSTNCFKTVWDKILLWQGFIVEKHGIRLLEAQIATGGIIDPVANHRLPVEIAFEKGLKLFYKLS